MAGRGCLGGLGTRALRCDDGRVIWQQRVKVRPQWELTFLSTATGSRSTWVSPLYCFVLIGFLLTMRDGYHGLLRK